MGFDLGDLYNPIEGIRDTVNGISSGVGFSGTSASSPGTYATVRGPNGQPVAQPTTYGQLLSNQTGLPAPVGITDGTRQALLVQQGGLAGQFADQAQQGYMGYSGQAQQALGGLQAMANGQNSVSQLQLQQAMQQNLAQQRSMAASASPQNAAMAARTAAIQSGRINAGLAGQQAVAGLQERNQAQSQYGQLLGNLRGQDLQATLGSRQNAAGAYGSGQYGAPQPSAVQQYAPVIVGGLAAAASDRRLKKDVRNADDKAAAAASKIPSWTYAYKDKRFGEGKHMGPMAQDLERAGLGHTVASTPGGKVVNGAKLALANTAMVGAMARRLDKLEGKGK